MAIPAVALARLINRPQFNAAGGGVPYLPEKGSVPEFDPQALSDIFNSPNPEQSWSPPNELNQNPPADNPLSQAANAPNEMPPAGGNYPQGGDYPQTGTAPNVGGGWSPSGWGGGGPAFGGWEGGLGPRSHMGTFGQARFNMRQRQQPAYRTLAHIGQPHVNPIPKANLLISQRFADGGIATDDTDNPPWQPQRSGGETGSQATSPDNTYQGGGTVDWSRVNPADVEQARQRMAYDQAMTAMRPQTARPIYTGVMLARPPQQLSGYYGELGGGYQEGGIVNPYTGKVDRNYAAEGGGAYYYVDPRTAAPSLSTSSPIYLDLQSLLGTMGQGQPAEMGGYYPADQIVTDPKTGEMQSVQFQGGGVVYPNVQLDAAGMPTVSRQQAPQQQASPVAGEPSKKQKPAAQPQHYEFGPSDFYYSAPLMKKLMEQQTATLEKGFKEGGVIPKQFMQWLADGGVAEDRVRPDHHLMFALGTAYGLSRSQAKKGMDKISRPNPMPP